MTGETIVIKGEISGNEDLTITGRVEGQITLGGRVLTLAAGSHVKGSVLAGTVIVSGTVDGSVTATSRLEVRNTAVIDGELSAPALFVADGAQVNGIVDMTERQRRAVA